MESLSEIEERRSRELESLMKAPSLSGAQIKRARALADGTVKKQDEKGMMTALAAGFRLL